jgi:hypothetical protein
MARITSCRRIRKAFDPIVCRSDRSLVTVLVTCYTAETCVVRRVDVASRARHPNGLLMGTGIDREPSVVKGCSGPGGRRVTGSTGCGESCRRVIWICRAVVIRYVARIAIRRCADKYVIYMAGSAGYRCMPTG